MHPQNRRSALRATGIVSMAAAMAALAGCAHRHPEDNSPTLKSLETRTFEVPPDKGVPASDDATIAAYRDYLKKAPKDAQRPEAMRRLGDLEMESADNRLAGGAAADKAGAAAMATAPGPAPVPAATAKTPAAGAVPGAIAKAPELDARTAPPVASAPGAGKGAISAPATAATSDAQNYRGAVTMYLELLKTYPKAPDNDKVLYQLAHAYELSGELENALKVLNRLVQEYPRTSLIDEAQFRRGELMFAMQNYHGAEEAYATILATRTHTPYFERALYMHGWSLYKQDRLEEALQSFFGVLDLKLIAREGEASLDAVAGLTRADRELVEDTLRVVSLCLENLQGAESIPPYMGSALRRDYEFRIYRQLGELYLAQERVKDAADTFLSFARRYPLHAQAPILRARVIEIYQQAGFDNLVLNAKREYVDRYSLHGEFHKANPAGWEQTLPRLKSYLTELARRDHAIAQKSHKSEDYQAAAVWYRQFIETFPKDPDTAQANFLLPSCCSRTSTTARPRSSTRRPPTTTWPTPRAPMRAMPRCWPMWSRRSSQRRPTSPESRTWPSRARSALPMPSPPIRATGPVLANAAERLYAMHDLDAASAVAHKVLKVARRRRPRSSAPPGTVIGLAAFDSGAFDKAEAAYTELLARTAANDPERAALTERLAACVYKQGEQGACTGQAARCRGRFQPGCRGGAAIAGARRCPVRRRCGPDRPA